MNLLFFFKILADLCFYLSIASFFGVSFGLKDALIPHALLVALACALGRAWDAPETDKQGRGARRFMPLSLLAAALLAQQLLGLTGKAGAAGLVILLPCFAYGFYCLQKRAWDPQLSESRSQFLLLVKILPFLFVIGLFAMDFGRLSAYTLPHAVLFLSASVLLLRMLRQKPSVLRDKRFLFANGAAAAGALLAAMVLSSKAFLGAVSSALGALWSLLVTPLLAIITAVAMLVYWLFSLLFSGILAKNEGQELQIEMRSAEEILEEAGLAGEGDHPVLAALFAILLAALIVFIIYRLFRRLRPAVGAAKAGVSLEQRSFLAPGEENRRSGLGLLLGGSPEDRVRRRYIKVLKLCERKGAQGLAGATTHQQMQIGKIVLPGCEKELEALRTLYLAARYGERTDAEAAKEADRLWKAVQEASRRR